MIVRFMHNYAVLVRESMRVMEGFKGFERVQKGSNGVVGGETIPKGKNYPLEPFRPFVCGNAVDVAVDIL